MIDHTKIITDFFLKLIDQWIDHVYFPIGGKNFPSSMLLSCLCSLSSDKLLSSFLPLFKEVFALGVFYMLTMEIFFNPRALSSSCFCCSAEAPIGGTRLALFLSFSVTLHSSDFWLSLTGGWAGTL